MTLPPINQNFNSSILKGTTLFLPTVSTGNVPQLTLDLLIASFNETQRLGSLHSPYVLNACGPDAFGKVGQLAMPMEVYYLPSRQWTFLQFRAPVIQACAEDFCVLFLAWIKQVGFSKLFLIGSADGGYRTDCLIEGTPSFRYF
ncbi:hypothetical protein HMI54_002609, partial [Coelomomyces lativittatus]